VTAAVHNGNAWPGAERRNPPYSLPTYAVRAPLARWIAREAADAGRTRGRFRLLDVGCGGKPYYPFFEPFGVEYVGLDVVDNPCADLRGTVEDIPAEDGSFDVVLCTQVLEHADEPARAVRELRRVTAPGGRLLASTHGVQVYHPSPADYWRWTHAGLEKLFRENGDWSALTVTPASGTAACVGMLLAVYLELGTKRTRVAGAGRAAVAALNRVSEAIDRRSARLREAAPGTLHANYHVVADVAPA
jgi:SAM-dependent methyltransferase